MRRAAISVAVLLGGLASAGSSSGTMTVPGTIVDVEIADAGQFIVATDGVGPGTDAGFEVLFVGPTPQFGRAFALAAGQSPLVDAFLDPNGDCLAGYDDGGARSGCAGPAIPSVLVHRVRHIQDGGAYSYGSNSSNFDTRYQSAPANAWSSLAIVPNTFAAPAGALAATHALGHDYGALCDNLCYLLTDGTSSLMSGTPRQLGAALYAWDGGLQVLFAGGAGLIWEQSDGGSSIQVVPNETVTGVSFSGATNSAPNSVFGDGFGMAIQRDGGVFTVLSAVPDPNAPAMTWQPNGPLSALATTVQPDDVVCWSGDSCALWAHSAGENLILYKNIGKPIIDSSPVCTLDEASSKTCTVDAGDPDGDAIFITWDGGVGGILTIQRSSPDGRSFVVTVDAGSPMAFCSSPSSDIPVLAIASDGFMGHETATTVPITVLHTLGPGTPIVVLAPGGDVQAGAASSTTFTATPDPNRCQPQGFAWSLTVGGVLAGTGTGSSTSFATPPFICSAAGEDAIVSFVASDSFGNSSDAGSGTLHIDPWGQPAAPQISCPSALLTGSTALCSTDGGSPCGVAVPFPGVNTFWSLDTHDAGVTFLGGGLTATGASAQLTADLCQPNASVTVSAYDQTLDDAGFFGDAGSFVLPIQFNPPSLSVASFSLDGGFSGGALSAFASSTASCPSLRGLEVGLVVDQGGDFVLDAGPYPMRDGGAAIGPILIPGACTPAPYVATATFSDEGANTPQTATFSFDSTFIPAGFSDVSPHTLPVTCESSAIGDVTPIVSAGNCIGESFSWSQSSVVPIALSSAGTGVALSKGDGADLWNLIGQTVSFSVQVDAGIGNGATRTASVQLIPGENLLAIDHQIDPPIGTEGGPLTVTVTVRGTTSCRLPPYEIRERLEGLIYVADSGVSDDGLGSVEWDGGMLVLHPAQIALTDGGVAGAVPQVSRMRFVARPKLLSSPKISAQAFMVGYPVSSPTGLGSVTSGCGCTTGGSSIPLVGLAALASLLRRRRLKARS